MRKNIVFKPLATAAAVAMSFSAGATGFQLLELNASGLGNAYAGSAAVAENASTIFFNPAGMTQLKPREYSLGVAAIQPSLKFSDSGSSVGALSGTGNGGDGGSLGIVPNAYLSWAYDKDLYFGLGFGIPFGLSTKYDKPWLGAAHATNFEIKTFNLNPSVAYRLNDVVSIGAGLNWQRLDAKYERVAGVADLLGPGSGALLAATPVKLHLDDDSWGWNVGALFTVTPTTKLGLSYRASIKYEMTGDIAASGPNAVVNGLISGNAKSDIKLPDTFITSLTHEYSDRWEILADVSRTGWGKMPKIDIVQTSGAAAGTTAQTLNTDFRNTWRIAVGTNYAMSDDLKLKFGLAYDQTPIKGASSRMVSLPENNHYWLSFGGQWKTSKDAVLDVGTSYLYMKDAPIDNDQTLAGAGRVTGTYQDSAWILGAQYSVSF